MALHMAAEPDCSPTQRRPAQLAIAPERWIRTTKRTRGGAFFALVFAVGWTAVFFATIANGNPHNTTGGDIGFGVFVLGIDAFLVVCARRLSRAGLLMSRDGVVVRGPFKTWAVPLADAESFEPGVQAGGGNGTPCPMLKRKNGGAIGVWALGHEGVVWRYRQYLRDLEPLCDELNAVLGAVRAESAPRR